MNMANQGHVPLVMVIDDNPEFLSGITLTLEMEGFKVWTAENGQDAWDQLLAAFLGHKQQDDEFVRAPELARLPDLILADIMMPVMDGYQFYESVRANPYLNHIPFIFLTAKSGDQDIRYGKELGADDYLTKLASPEDLLASVRGKLKRVEQQRSLAEQFTGGSLEGNKFVLIIAMIVLILMGFCLGYLVTAVFLV